MTKHVENEFQVLFFTSKSDTPSNWTTQRQKNIRDENFNADEFDGHQENARFSLCCVEKVLNNSDLSLSTSFKERSSYRKRHVKRKCDANEE